ARAVERAHQELARPVTEGLGGDELLELWNEAGRRAGVELRLEPVLDRAEPEVLQPRGGRLAERLGAELAQRRAAPQVERLLQAFRRRAKVARGELLPGRCCKRLEAVDVELALDHPELVAGRPCHEPLRAERLPELRDVDLERLRRAARRLLAPELVDEPLGRHDAVPVEEEKREERAG